MTPNATVNARPTAEAAPAELLHAGQGWGWILAYGILSAAFGLFAFLAPFSATLAATIGAGAMLVVIGIGSLVSGFAGRGHEGRGYAIVLGLLTLAVGLVTAFRPLTGAISLTLLIAAWLGARGVLELVLGFRYRSRRGWMLALGVLNLLLAGLIVWTVPYSALTLPGYVLGLSLLFGGVTAIGSALHHRKGASAFALPA
jgi:uncharacterized membrane protein HdeD (DUF308 family)